MRQGSKRGGVYARVGLEQGRQTVDRNAVRVYLVPRGWLHALLHLLGSLKSSCRVAILMKKERFKKISTDSSPKINKNTRMIFFFYRALKKQGNYLQ